jgi:hypothetical protein
MVEMREFIPPHLTLLNFQELLVNMNSFITYIPIVQYIILSFNLLNSKDFSALEFSQVKAEGVLFYK